MSKEIDEKVVEMRFDNKNFEENVKTSMSTLDKLKKSLNFDGATKGLENIEKASKQLDMSSLSGAIETVHNKFSALEVIGITTLANITNTAVNAGKKLVSSLSIDQVTAGWQKYADKTTAVQTIMNATGDSIESVNGQLEKLNWFTDETSYNFIDMVNNIGKFTSNGVKLDSAVTAMEGISTAAALAGQNSQAAQRAMYNFSQALGTGAVKVQDWMSIENANMATKEFKETIIETAKELGNLDKGGKILKKTGKYAGDANVTFSNFRSTLAAGWFDSEVLVKSLEKYGGFANDLNKAVEKTDMETSELLRIVEKYKKGQLDIEKTAKETGLTVKEFSEIMNQLGSKENDLGYRAFKAAQEAKTFNEAIDAVKDAVSTSWMNTFEIIFGNYEQARKLWTGFSEWLWEIFASGGEARNNFLKEALNMNPYTKLMEKIGKVTESIKTVTDKVVDYDAVINKIIKGDFGSGQARWDKLTAAGYDWAYAQNLVNEKLGSTVRHATNYTKAQENITKKTIELTDAKLKELGLTEEEIKMYRSLEEQSKKTGKSISELVNEMSENDGRSLLIGGFKNIGDLILDTISTIKEAWSDVFSFNPVQLYNVIKSFNEFTKRIQMSDEASQKLHTTFKGLFDTLDLILKISKAPFVILKDIIVQTAKNLDVGILDVTAKIGELLSKLHDWIVNNEYISKGVNLISSILASGIKIISKWINTLAKSQTVRKVVTALFTVFKTLGSAVVEIIKELYNFTKKWLDKLKESTVYQKTISKLKDWYHKLGSAISSVADKTLEWSASVKKSIQEHKLLQKIGELFLKIGSYIKIAANYTINWIKEILKSEKAKQILSWLGSTFKDIGIHIWDLVKATAQWIQTLLKSNGVKSFLDFIFDVFKKAADIGINIIDGIKNGLTDGSSGIFGFVKNLASTILDVVKKVLGIHSPSTEFYDIGVNCIEGFIEGLKAFFKTTFNTIENLFSEFTTFVKNLNLGKILAVVVSAGAIAAGKALFDILGSFARAFENFSKPAASAAKFLDSLTTSIKGFGDAAKITAKSNFIKSFAVSILILSGSLLLLTTVPQKKLWSAFGLIAALSALMIGFIALSDKISKGKGSLSSILDVIMMTIGISTSLLILSKSMEKIAKLDENKIAGVMGYLIVIFGGLIALLAVMKTKITGDQISMVNTSGKIFIEMAVAIGILGIVSSLLGKLNPETFDQGLKAIAIFSSIIIALSLVVKQTTKGLKDPKALGTIIIEIAAAMAILAGICKILGGMDITSLGIGLAGVGALTLIVWALMAILKKSGGNRKLTAISAILIGIAACMGILAMTAKIIAGMSITDMGKGALGLIGLVAIVGLLMSVVKLVGGKTGSTGLGVTLLGIAFTIGVLAAITVLMGLVSPDVMLKGVVACGILVLMMSLLIKALKGANEAKGSIAAMTSIIIAIAASALVLSFLETGKLAQGVASIGILLGVLAVVLNQIKNITGNEVKTLVVVAVIFAILGGVLVLLSTLPSTNSAITSAASIILVLASLVGVLVLLKKMSKDTEAAKTGIKLLSALLIPVLGIAVALMLMKDVKDAISASIGITILLLASTLIIFILSKMSTFGDALKGIVLLTALLIPIAGFVAALYILKDVGNALQNAIAISSLLIICTVILYALIPMGALWELALIGMACLTAMVVPMAAFIGALWLMEGLDNAGPNADIIINILEKMTICLAVLAILSPGLVLAEACLYGLIPIIGLMSTLVLALAGLEKLFPNIKTFIETGIDLLVTLAGGIGKVIGAFVANALDSAVSTLPHVGEQLSSFMEKAKGFLEGIKNVDPKIKEKVEALVGSLISITAGQLWTNILNWLSGGNSIDDFGNMLNKLGPYLKTFGENVKNIQGVNIEKIANACMTISNMLDDLPDADIDDINEYGEELKTFASCLNDFYNDVKFINTEKIKEIAEAGKVLADMSKSFPNSGGWLGAIVGNNDGDMFGKQMAAFGESLKTFSDNVKDVVPDNIKQACEAGKALAEMADEFPNSGGWLGAIVGENDGTTFGKQMENFASSLVNFSNIVSGQNGSQGVNLESIRNGVNAGLELANLGKEIKSIKGFTTYLQENDMESFKTKIVAFGEGIKNYSSKMSELKDLTSSTKQLKELFSTFNEIGKVKSNNLISLNVSLELMTEIGNKMGTFAEMLVNFSNIVSGQNGSQGVNLESIRNGVNAGLELARLGEKLYYIKSFISFIQENDMESFKTKIVAFGEGIKNYSSKMFELKDLKSSTDQLEYLFDVLSDVSKMNISSINSFSSSLETLAKKGINNFKDAFKNSTKSVNEAINSFFKSITSTMQSDSNKKTFSTVGETLLKFFVSSIKMTKDIKTTFNSFISSCVTTIREKQKDFSSAGVYLMEGFINGINSKKPQVSSTSSSIASSFLTLLNKGLSINSPSKATYKIGEYTIQGFVNALMDYTDLAGKAGYSVAESVKDGFNDAISKVEDYINGNVDSQPTIRPVLDLTNIEAGSRLLNSMLSNEQAYALASGSTFGNQNGIPGVTINMTVNGAPGQDVNQLAEAVSEKINKSIQRRNGVWR